MIGEAAEALRMTADEYLAWEREQPDKHEFKDGEVFAMSGGSPRHALLGAAVLRDLGAAMQRRDCRTFSSDLRIAARPRKHYVYADGVVVCGRLILEEGTNDVLKNPVVIVEVLSKSTERYDRGEKWEAYQRLASLKDYVLVSQEKARIEHFQRAEVDWLYRDVGPGGTVTLSNGVTLSVDSIFEGALDLEGS